MISRFPGSTLFCRLVKPALCLPQVLLEFLPFLLGGEQIARQPVNSGGCGSAAGRMGPALAGLNRGERGCLGYRLLIDNGSE
jgi:hypothetical protein